MSLSILPIELLEILFLYLSVDDILNAWAAVRDIGSDNFWRKVCKKQGFAKSSSKNEGWRDVFQRNINWTKSHFEKRKFKLNHFSHESLDYNNLHFCFNATENKCNIAIFGENLAMNGHEGNLQLWSVENEPVLMQSLPVDKFRLSKSKLVTINSCLITVYSMVDSVFSNMTSFSIECPIISENYWCFTDMHLAVFDPKQLLLTIFYLMDSSVINIAVSTVQVMIFSLVIKVDYLFIYLLEGGQYKIKVFHLEDRKWLEDLSLLQGSAMISVPKIKISSKYVVSWCYSFENNQITPLKIWRFLDGNFKLVVSEQCFYSKEELKPITDVLWLLIKGDYIVFSTSRTDIVVWHSANPKHCKLMTKSDNNYFTQKIVSNTILVLLYSYGFKIIDFTTANYLYEVYFDGGENTESSLLINNLFLIILEKEKDACEIYDSNDCPLVKRASKESSLQLLTNCKCSCTLSMYDFRAQLQSLG